MSAVRAGLKKFGAKIASYEAGPSKANQTTGESKNGQRFETRFKNILREFARERVGSGAAELVRVSVERSPHAAVRRTPARRFGLVNGRRLLLFEMSGLKPPSGLKPTRHVMVPEDFISRGYRVQELMRDRFTPNPDLYPDSFNKDSIRALVNGSGTRFDGTALLCELRQDIDGDLQYEITDGDVVQKTLLELKSGKSSKGTSLDGNAHERLTDRMLLAAELALSRLHPWPVALQVHLNSAFTDFTNRYIATNGSTAERIMAMCAASGADFKISLAYRAHEHAKRLAVWDEWLAASPPSHRAGSDTQCAREKVATT